MSFFDNYTRSGRRRANSVEKPSRSNSESSPSGAASPKSTSPPASGSSTPTGLKTPTPHTLLQKRAAYVLPPQPDPPASPPPPRPVRNPARVVVPAFPRAKLGKARPSTATGAREVVTPWELAPPPTASQINMGASLSSINYVGPSVSTHTIFVESPHLVRGLHTCALHS